MQLGDCRLERGDKEPFAITSHESKAIECLERVGTLEIKVALRTKFSPFACFRPSDTKHGAHYSHAGFGVAVLFGPR